MNPCVICCTNCVDECICVAVPAAAEIECAAFYEMAI